MARVLGKAASELDSLAKSDSARIIGQVKTLDQRDRVKVVGDVQLGRRDEPIHRGIWVRVSPREYDLAYGAQVSGQEVEAAGRLTRTDRRFELQPDSAGLFLRGH